MDKSTTHFFKYDNNDSGTNYLMGDCIRFLAKGNWSQLQELILGISFAIIGNNRIPI